MSTKKAGAGSWDSPVKTAIGEQLLDERELRTAAELAAALGADQSNVKKVADTMVEDGLLITDKPHLEPRGRGRRAESGYKLQPRERAGLEAVLEPPSPGMLRAGQQLVLASVANGAELVLMEAVKTSAAAARMSWAAFLDGQPQECVIAFDGADALSRAGDLIAALARAEVDSRRVTVAGVSDRRGFLRDARRRSRLAERQPGTPALSSSQAGPGIGADL